MNRKKMLFFSAVLFLSVFLLTHGLFAAPANITLTQDVATIEVSTSTFTATKSNIYLSGTLTNGGSNKIWISTTVQNPVPTTDTQVIGVIGLAAGSSLKLLRSNQSFTYNTAAGTSVLYWTPDPY